MSERLRIHREKRAQELAAEREAYRQTVSKPGAIPLTSVQAFNEAADRLLAAANEITGGEETDTHALLSHAIYLHKLGVEATVRLSHLQGQRVGGLSL